MEFSHRERFRVDQVKEGDLLIQADSPEKAKAGGVVQQYGEVWKEQAWREGKNYKLRGNVMQRNEWKNGKGQVKNGVVRCDKTYIVLLKL